MRVTKQTGLLGSSLLLAAGRTSALELDVTNRDSVLQASKTIVGHILDIYNNGSSAAVPGLFPDPYYFWESGLAFDSLTNYWALSGDNDVRDTIVQALAFQVGPDNNYMPPNQSKSLGNDDQSSWALAAMTAAERGLPQPNGTNVTWLQLAENVFNSQVARWDDGSCNGGLRWQVFTFNAGYNYKNSQTQANFAQLGARLARFTGNSTYLDWAQRSVDWLSNVGLLRLQQGAVYDGTDTTTNCSQINHIQWTINVGQLLGAGAYASNVSSTRYWNGLNFAMVESTNIIFTSSNDTGVLYEVACAPNDNCNVDQLAFRAPLARALANARDLTIDSSMTSNGTSTGTLHSNIYAILKASAEGAAAQCSGGDDGTVCGSDWTSSTWDGTQGLGQDLAALEIILANLPTEQLNTANQTVSGTNGTSTVGGASTSGSSTPSASAYSSGVGSLAASMLGLGLMALACVFVA